MHMAFGYIFFWNLELVWKNHVLLFFQLFTLGIYYLKTSGSTSGNAGHGNASQSGVKAECLLPKTVGPCRAAMPRFYYEKEKQACEQFIYGGCSGNGNNFKTKEECDNTCHHP